MVTADGRFLKASTTENPDLFWGVRGGGGWNFGIVTSFEYQLHPVGPTVLAGLAFYPFAKAKEFLKLYRDFSGEIPDEMNTIAGLGTSPEGHPVAVIAACYHGSIKDGESALRPLRDFGPPLVDHIQPMPYAAAQKMLAPLSPPGRQYYIKSTFMKEISDAAIDTMISHFAKVTSPLSAMIFQQVGNAAKRVDPEEAAFSHRDAQYEWAAFSAWLDPGESEIHIRWAREFSEAMQPFTLGRDYVNQIGTEAEEGADRIRAAYGASYQRLVALKNKYDPSNLFRYNQNIKPTVRQR
jgi:FAD/FMN-containing dehydrogenase